MKSEEIIRKLREIDVSDFENFDKLDFSLGIVRDKYETFNGVEFGPVIHYIESAGIYFPISEDSSNRIIEKIKDIRERKESIGDKKK